MTDTIDLLAEDNTSKILFMAVVASIPAGSNVVEHFKIQDGAAAGRAEVKILLNNVEVPLSALGGVFERMISAMDDIALTKAKEIIAELGGDIREKLSEIEVTVTETLHRYAAKNGIDWYSSND